MVARFCVGNVEGDVPAAWEDGAQLVAAAPPDGDRVRAAFSIRRHVTDGDLNALVDQVTPRGAREVSRASKTVIGRHAIALEIEIAPPGGEAVFEHTLWVASSGSASALTLTGRAARARELRPVAERIFASLDGRTGRDQGLRFSMGSLRVFLPPGFASDVPVSLLQPARAGAFRQSIMIVSEPAIPPAMLAERARRVAASYGAQPLHRDQRMIAGVPAYETHIEVAGSPARFSTEIALCSGDALETLRVTGAASDANDVAAVTRKLAASLALREQNESTASGLSIRPSPTSSGGRPRHVPKKP